MGVFLPLVTTLIWLYILWRFVMVLPFSAGTKVVIAVVLLAIAHYHQVTSRMFGSLASAELPQWVLIALAWAFGLFLLLALLTLLRDLLGLVTWLPARTLGRTILQAKSLNLLVGGLALVLASTGVWQAVKIPAIKTIELQLESLPAQFDGYEIVQISDIHASRLLPEYWQAAVVAKANALNPDLIVITGDLADGSVVERQNDIRPLADLQAKDGVIAVPGNHEYYTDYVSWMTALRELGLLMLENEYLTIRRDEAEIIIAGLTDRQATAFAQNPPDLAAALAEAPTYRAPVILLQHRPGSANENAEFGVMLQLSGHTHGGQILGGHFLTQMVNGGYVSGLYQVGKMKLYVSNGTGLWHGLAIRVGRPSEITRIVLRSLE